MLKFSFSDCKVTVFQRDTEIILHFFFIFCIFPSLWPPFPSHFRQKSTESDPDACAMLDNLTGIGFDSLRG